MTSNARLDRAIAAIARRQDNVITHDQLLEAGLGNPGAHRGIRLHRPRALARHDVVTMRGIPITSVARTICDLAATESPREVEQAFQEALYPRHRG